MKTKKNTTKQDKCLNAKKIEDYLKYKDARLKIEHIVGSFTLDYMIKKDFEKYNRVSEELLQLAYQTVRLDTWLKEAQNQIKDTEKKISRLANLAGISIAINAVLFVVLVVCFMRPA